MIKIDGKRPLDLVISKDLIEKIEIDEDYKGGKNYALEYFSFYIDIFKNDDFRDGLEEYGPHYVMFFNYLVAEMISKGKYYILEKNIGRIIKDYCNLYSNCDKELIKKIFDDFILCNIVSVFKDLSFFDNPIATNRYAIYNYICTSNKRCLDRKRQQEYRKKKKEENNPPAPTAPLPPPPKVSAEELFDMGEVAAPDPFEDEFGEESAW